MSTHAAPGVDHDDPDAPTPTPIWISPRTRMILIVATVILFCLLAWAAPSIPRLLILGATVALVLSFPVRVLSRWIPRRWAIAITVGSTVMLLLLLLLLLIPFVISEISEFISVLPAIVDDTRELARRVLEELATRGWLDQNPDAVVNDLEASLFARGQELAESLLGNLLEALTRSLTVLISTFGVLFIATYLLIDVPRFRQTFTNAFAASYRPDADLLWTTIGESLSRYLGGLLLSITIQGVMATIGLWVMGVPYAFILGLWMAATAILPYIGAFLGGIPAVIIAATISWQLAVATIVLYVVINQTEGNLITPRIQGNAVRVHPVLIFVAVLLGGELGGALGAIIAVPTLAIVRVLADFFWVRLRVRGPHDHVLSAIGGETPSAATAPTEPSAPTPPVGDPAVPDPVPNGPAGRTRRSPSGRTTSL